MISAQDLPRISDSLSYLYTERSRIEQDGGTIAIVDDDGRTPVPCASIATLILGPGTTVTHAAVKTLTSHGCAIVWAGEQAIRTYASTTSKARNTHLLQAQAQQWANRRSRLAVARRMYDKRFPGEDISRLTMQQLRGREGARMRSAYRAAADEAGVYWTNRSYKKGQWERTDPPNRALSAANSCLYGICHAAITSLGCSPGLGFIHTGNALSFVHDIADLYKTKITIPIAFKVTADRHYRPESTVRRSCREAFRHTRLLEQIVRDIQVLLDPETTNPDEAASLGDVTFLWDPTTGLVNGAVNHAETEEAR